MEGTFLQDRTVQVVKFDENLNHWIRVVESFRGSMANRAPSHHKAVRLYEVASSVPRTSIKKEFPSSDGEILRLNKKEKSCLLCQCLQLGQR